jgi:hypothetical protein
MTLLWEVLLLKHSLLRLFQNVSDDGLSRLLVFANGFVIVEVPFEARQSVCASSKFFRQGLAIRPIGISFF